MTHYRRKPADASVLASAVTAGAVIGAATFYLVKLWLQREPLDPVEDVEGDVGPRNSDGVADEGTGDGAVDREGGPEPETSEGTESSP